MLAAVCLCVCVCVAPVSRPAQNSIQGTHHSCQLPAKQTKAGGVFASKKLKLQKVTQQEKHDFQAQHCACQSDSFGCPLGKTLFSFLVLLPSDYSHTCLYDASRPAFSLQPSALCKLSSRHRLLSFAFTPPDCCLCHFTAVTLSIHHLFIFVFLFLGRDTQTDQ